MTDLRPIQRLPLEEFIMASTLVTSLEPLRHLSRLTYLRVFSCQIDDVAPLAGLPLRQLSLGQLPLSDISPLRSLALRHAIFPDCHALRDLSALDNCRSLGRLILPPGAQNIEFLRDTNRFPHLKDLAYLEQDHYQPPAVFWRAYDARKDSAK